MSDETVPLLEVRNLVKHYREASGARVRALDDVSLTVRRGEVVGIVGESGCGKTTLGRTIMRLVEPTSGEIRVDGVDFASLSGAKLKAARRRVQMVFQDPFGSLNPRHKVGVIIAEPLVVHGVPGAKARVAELLDLVGLPGEAAGRYPHEFSGGQRQRIAIARALALDPALIIADEPVSALDVSIQSQIINLIGSLRARLGLSMIFISHDLSVVRHVSDRVGVMYFGKLVELAPTSALFERPRHPYTSALLASVPRPVKDVVREKRAGAGLVAAAPGEIPDPANPPPGCAYAARCPLAEPRCREAVPPLAAVETGHEAACWRSGEVAAREPITSA
ncbi:ABC transporter ATP-binding protein [Salinarimonas ramus]|uniref:ABC transporter ATP-binding protein n=1 Tax=Salinarimonas ramus TaxID=690164 RepID=A0A917V876_9HYPH|nr:oligopeptide/dipeptide ABC transporter ATP-binding protein [Salinarimonas ramus]GGK48750.1 ABC transporter ATP-binding protein [Salinarimonas ramus]